MTPSRTQNNIAPRALLAVIVLCIAQAWALPAAFGQAEPIEIEGLELDQELLERPWVDPIEAFELGDEPLAAVPDFDFGELSASSLFEEGVENLEVRDEDDFGEVVSEESENHLRALQAVATAELARSTVDRNIASAEAAIDEATNGIERARQNITRIEQEITSAEGEIREILIADQAEINELERLAGEVNALSGAIIEIAIQAFTGENMELETLLTDPENTDVIERRVVTNEVREFQRADIAALEGLIREGELRRDALAAERSPIEAANATRAAEIAGLTTRVDELAAERERDRQDIIELEARGDDLDETIELAVDFSNATAAQYSLAYHQRLDRFVAESDIPLVALNAYVRASRTLADEDPGCGIHWSQIAGIGRIESIHGYFGDSTLDVNGRTTEDILGLPLDGRLLSGQTTGPVPDATGRTQEANGVVRLALITDTDNGRLDGDDEFDRAVGPMQFIPTTWQLYESDGNGDGVADPQNIYDASLATARLLCDSAGSMITTSGEQRGYFAYNHDLAYSANVTRAGRSYHERLDVAPESSAFASFALLPTPAEIAAAEAAAQLEAEIEAARTAALAACVAGPDAGAEGAAEPELDPDGGEQTLSPEAQAAADAVVCPEIPVGVDDPEPATSTPPEALAIVEE